MSNRQQHGLFVASFIAAALAFLIAASISAALAGPVATFSRQAIDFGGVADGSASTVQPVFVTNTGDAPLAISGTSTSGADAASFSVAGTCTTPISLPPAARCRLDFVLHGSAIAMPQATFSLQSDSLPPPSPIALSGFRTQGGSTVTRSPDWIDFPATPSGGTAAPQSINFFNNEDFLSFKVLAVNLVGGDSSEFSLTSTCVVGASVPKPPGCDATIGFHPTAPGPRSTELRFDFAGGPSPRFTFSITGVGGAAGPPPTVTVIEYHHASFDHYFVTPDGVEIALLDAKTPPFQEWSRTGFSFNAYANATAPASSVSICRLFNSSFAPKSSHFYAPKGSVCEDTLRIFPDWVLENDHSFNTMLPDGGGNCPAGTVPVYRLYNGGMGGAPNHRFVTSTVEQQKMVGLLWVPEGPGGVGMCVPP